MFKIDRTPKSTHTAHRRARRTTTLLTAQHELGVDVVEELGLRGWHPVDLHVRVRELPQHDEGAEKQMNK